MRHCVRNEVRGGEEPLWIPTRGDFAEALAEILLPPEPGEAGIDASFISFPAAEHCQPKHFPDQVRLTEEASATVRRYMTDGDIGLIRVVQMQEGTVLIYAHDEARLMKQRLIEVPKTVFARWCIECAKEGV